MEHLLYILMHLTFQDRNIQKDAFLNNVKSCMENSEITISEVYLSKKRHQVYLSKLLLRYYDKESKEYTKLYSCLDRSKFTKFTHNKCSK